MSESPVSQQSIPYGNGAGSATPQYANGQGSAPAESAVRKKLNGYVGFANLPNQVHRKSVRTGFQFTVMVVGGFLFSQHRKCTRNNTMRFSVAPRACYVSFASCSFFLFVLGESGLGKSTLINTLFNTTLYPPKEHLHPSAERPKTVAIESISAGMFCLNTTSNTSELV